MVKYWDDFTSGGDGTKVLEEQGAGIQAAPPIAENMEEPAEGEEEEAAEPSPYEEENLAQEDGDADEAAAEDEAYANDEESVDMENGDEEEMVEEGTETDEEMEETKKKKLKMIWICNQRWSPRPLSV